MNYETEFNAARERACKALLQQDGPCADAHAALVMLRHGTRLDEVNRLLSGQVRELTPRGLDLQVYYTILANRERGLSPEAAQYVTERCDRVYGQDLPPYVDLGREFNPWDYQLCGCPTENHLFNDTSCRLAESVVFPERRYSDSRTAADYRPYWEDAFRQLVTSRIRHGLREWRSTIYCHVLFDDALMIYNVLPPGRTRDAARLLLDYMFLGIAITLRGRLWTGPHSRVYNPLQGGVGGISRFTQCYGGYAAQLLGEHFMGGVIVSDYVVPEAVARLPFRTDRYVSVETVGPRFYPRGEGQDRFNPGNVNVYLCTSDREDWGGDGLVYNYLSPRFGLGSVQDWGGHDGEWHMHSVPWAMMFACDDCRDIVLSFTGSREQSTHQGGPMTWCNQDNDQDATIFQHRKTLFSQMRGWHRDKIYEVLWDGFPEAPWARASGRKRLLSHAGETTRFHSRFYISDTIVEVREEGGWVLGEKHGVCFAIRPVRGACRREEWPDCPGQFYVCDVWDDVILLECAESDDVGGFEAFCRAVQAASLSFDERCVTFTNLEGDTIRFCWKEEGDPTVNGSTPAYGGMRFDDPCVRSMPATGVIEIECDGARTVLDANAV